MAKPLSVYLIGSARKIWRWSPARKVAKERAQEGKKYRCAKCKALVAKIEIDHIEPVGTAPRDWQGWDEYYRKLFCSVDNLEGLCHQCHKEKSNEERKMRKLRKGNS